MTERVPTLFEREASMRELKSAFGAWLQIPNWYVKIVQDEKEIPSIAAIHTVYFFHNRTSAISLVNIRSLLNRLKRMEQNRPDVFIFDSSLMNKKTIAAFWHEEELDSYGAAILFQQKKMIARMNKCEELELFKKELERIFH
jgi:hypothetical protein